MKCGLRPTPVKLVKLEEDEAKNIMDVKTHSRIAYYDSAFVSLANKLGATLVTANPKHQKKFSGVKVIALKDYS